MEEDVAEAIEAAVSDVLDTTRFELELKPDNRRKGVRMMIYGKTESGERDSPSVGNVTYSGRAGGYWLDWGSPEYTPLFRQIEEEIEQRTNKKSMQSRCRDETEYVKGVRKKIEQDEELFESVYKRLREKDASEWKESTFEKEGTYPYSGCSCDDDDSCHPVICETHKEFRKYTQTTNRLSTEIDVPDKDGTGYRYSIFCDHVRDYEWYGGWYDYHSVYVSHGDDVIASFSKGEGYLRGEVSGLFNEIKGKISAHKEEKRLQKEEKESKRRGNHLDRLRGGG